MVEIRCQDAAVTASDWICQQEDRAPLMVKGLYHLHDTDLTTTLLERCQPKSEAMTANCCAWMPRFINWLGFI